MIRVRLPSGLVVLSLTREQTTSLFCDMAKNRLLGHEAIGSKCQELELFLPAVYLHGWYESATIKGIPE